MEGPPTEKGGKTLMAKTLSRIFSLVQKNNLVRQCPSPEFVSYPLNRRSTFIGVYLRILCRLYNNSTFVLSKLVISANGLIFPSDRRRRHGHAMHKTSVAWSAAPLRVQSKPTIFHLHPISHNTSKKDTPAFAAVFVVVATSIV